MGTNIPNDITVKAGSEPPSGVPAYIDAEQTDYVTVNIDGNLANRVTNGAIMVRVADDRMPDDPALVEVYHAADGKWDQVDRTYVGNNTFKVHMSSFSTFAVVVEDTTEPVTTTSSTTNQQPETTTTEPATITKTPVTTTRAPTTTKTSAPGFGFGLAATSVLIMGLLIFRKRRN